ncbi:DUF5675 family protein [Desulfobaculum sp.]
MTKRDDGAMWRTPVVELIRLETSAQGTFGVVRVDKRLCCCTLEPPERANAVNRSCIPVGQYLCRRRHSARFGNVYAVQDVPGRTGIVFHAGNTAPDTAGCILPGERVGRVGGARGVLASRRALAALAQAIGEETFHLTITRAY